MASETLEKIDRARVVIAQLNYGEREWKLNHPPREDDPDMVIHEALRSAALEISRLTREREEARELIRDLVDDEDAGLVWLGRRLVCAYCTADGLYSVAHAADCPIIRARHALAALRSEAQGRARSSLICETCGEEIRDDEEMVVWQDAYTHRRCTDDAALRAAEGNQRE